MVNSERIEITETEEIYSLRINKASMTDAGDYSLKLSNRLGQETKNASVTVKCICLYFITKLLQRNLNNYSVISSGGTSIA